jgi:DNA invertase Pin-like site-specific DNA recombinase
LGHAGIVLGLEVSRLARNSADWHRLIEICALTDTLILDEDGVYDPSHFNDRLLLGLKGTMSEAEIHVMRARLRGGILNKARRGELRTVLPVGFVYDADNRVVLDPDQQVQAAIRLLFQTFLRTGAATATVKYFREQKLLFPRAARAPSRHAGIAWGPLCVRRVLSVLRNPRYAGVYFYGRYRCRRMPDGSTRRALLPPEQWNTVIRDAHAGYISWEQQQARQDRLRQTARACFQYREDALRVQKALCQRLGRFSLTLEPTKTKLVEFGRFADKGRASVAGDARKRFISWASPCTALVTEKAISGSGCVRKNRACDARSRMRRTRCYACGIRHFGSRWTTSIRCFAATMGTTALPATFGHCNGSIGRWNAAGVRC